MAQPPASQSRLGRPLAAVAALALFAWAAMAADLARGHIAALGEICGGSVPHCGWCYAAAGLALSGALVLARAVSPRRALARARR